MDFTQLSNAALKRELINANHAAISDFLMLCALEDELDRKRGDKPNPYEPPAICTACNKPWHLASPARFTTGPYLAAMSEHDLMVQHSNYRHAGGDEYAMRVELEIAKRGL